MYTLEQQAHFARKLKRLLRKDRSLAEPVGSALKKLTENPRQPELKSHKVTALYDNQPAFSAYVLPDLRILWRYGHKLGEAQILDLIDIGGHSGSNKVYR